MLVRIHHGRSGREFPWAEAHGGTLKACATIEPGQAAFVSLAAR